MSKIYFYFQDAFMNKISIFFTFCKGLNRGIYHRYFTLSLRRDLQSRLRFNLYPAQNGNFFL